MSRTTTQLGQRPSKDSYKWLHRHRSQLTDPIPIARVHQLLAELERKRAKEAQVTAAEERDENNRLLQCTPADLVNIAKQKLEDFVSYPTMWTLQYNTTPATQSQVTVIIAELTRHRRTDNPKQVIEIAMECFRNLNLRNILTSLIERKLSLPMLNSTFFTDTKAQRSMQAILLRFGSVAKSKSLVHNQSTNMRGKIPCDPYIYITYKTCLSHFDSPDAFSLPKIQHTLDSLYDICKPTPTEATTPKPSHPEWLGYPNMP